MPYPHRIHLICLPYSGGSSIAFKPLLAHWPKSWKVSTLSFPGRGDRIKEPLVYTIEDLIDDCWQQIKGDLEEAYAFMGHSLGAILAYLLTHKVLEEGGNPPLHLFLSGARGPSVPPKLPYRYLMSKEDFKQTLKSYGGVPEEILKNEAAFDFFGSIIRADFQARETWEYTSKAPLGIPATVITGTEEGMSEEEILLWQKEFNTKVAFEKMEGNHFFLFSQAEQFVELVYQYLAITLLEYDD